MLNADISNKVKEFQEKNKNEDRNASFDYCYNYFRNSSADEIEQNIEKSCLHLMSYLASWGMLRGSSFLLKKSIKYYETLIKYIIELKRDDSKIFDIDVDTYTNDNMKLIEGVYIEINRILGGKASSILITKIMLGIFGCVPAYDINFTSTFKNIFKNKCGFSKMNINSLECIKEFYENNKKEIDELHQKIFTKSFITGQNSQIKYTRAKIIDMYGFQKNL